MSKPGSDLLIVLADDLTGAAEIAALGVEYGLTTELATQPTSANAQLLVIDTDTRPDEPARAGVKIASLLEKLPQTAHYFKKTDSVLRGQVGAELCTMMSALEKESALLLPQNPSKGRVIEGGRYFVQGTPLDETSFREDPEYPRRTAEVVRLLGGGPAEAVQLGSLGSATPPPPGITIGNGSSLSDLQRWIQGVNLAKTLVAGGADTFCAFLESRGHLRRLASFNLPHVKHTIIAAGSAAKNSRELVHKWAAEGRPICALPPADDCQSPGIPRHWANAASNLLAANGQVILAIRHPIVPASAVPFRTYMAEAVQFLIDSIEGSASCLLIVEGGATAAAIAARLRWDKFIVKGNIAPGVVLLRPETSPGIWLVIKPGSYPWPPAFL